MLSFLPPRRPALIGVVHLPPLPGSPRSRLSMDAIVLHAVADARAYSSGGADALIVENFGDAPFARASVESETVAAMAVCLAAVRAACPLPVGVNVLRNDARSALGLCLATGASFLRVNVLAGAAVTDQGIVEGEAYELLRARARLAPEVAILADVHVKHATQLSRESLAEACEELVGRSLADAVVVSGRATGKAPAPEDVAEAARGAAGAPVLLGSGVTLGNAADLCRAARGAIVGSSLKAGGVLSAPVDPARVRALRERFEALGGGA
ncbi:MAG: Photosystem biosis protein BtpA [Planctomycetota bacterium]|jgi:membrane complex biogenesis BtpA family protein